MELGVVGREEQVDERTAAHSSVGLLHAPAGRRRFASERSTASSGVPLARRRSRPCSGSTGTAIRSRRPRLGDVVGRHGGVAVLHEDAEPPPRGCRRPCAGSAPGRASCGPSVDGGRMRVDEHEHFSHTALMSTSLLAIGYDVINAVIWLPTGHRSDPRGVRGVARAATGRQGARGRCGTGAITKRFLAAGAQVTAIDRSSDMLDVARRRAPGADYRQCDVTSTELGMATTASCSPSCSTSSRATNGEPYSPGRRARCRAGGRVAVMEWALPAERNRTPGWHRIIRTIEPPHARARRRLRHRRVGGRGTHGHADEAHRPRPRPDGLRVFAKHLTVNARMGGDRSPDSAGPSAPC